MSAQTPSLASLQRWMLEALAAPDRVERPAIGEVLLPGARLDAAACLAIYQRSYILRLRRCLAEQFPATRHALGDALFDDFANDYLRACPSDSYTLYELGRRFPGWMEQSRPDRDLPAEQREEWIDFMVDLASYERELFRLFDAPGHEGQPWPGVSASDGELLLQPCLALARYRYDVAWYYHEVRAGQSPGLPPRSPSHVVIVRRDYQTVTYPVSALHHRFLSTLWQCGSIQQALGDIAAWTGRPLEDVVRSWGSEVRGPWIEAGFFVARREAERRSSAPSPCSLEVK